jgi:hypothetical protein
MMGALAPLARDEATFNKTTCHITSNKSLPKTAMAGRRPHRAARYYGCIGFTSHQRELLEIQQKTRDRLYRLTAHAERERGTERITIATMRRVGV